MESDDPANFACQYLNQPIHSSQQAYSKELILSTVMGPEQTPFLSQPIMVVDLATTTNVKSDDSVITIGKVDGLGVAYLCDMRGGQWQPMETAINVIDMALIHRPVRILLEKSATGTVFVEFLRLVARQKNVFLPLDFIKVDNRDDAKNMRVVSLAGVMKRKRFKILSCVRNLDKLIEQACEFPKGRHGHDDYIDTAALLYTELTKELLSMSVKQIIKDPILAMIADRENNLAKSLVVEAPPQTDACHSGLED
jgi:hypothetical protein